MHISKEPTGYPKPQFKTRIVFYRDIFRLLYGVSEAPPCIGLNTSEMPNQSGASEVDQVLQKSIPSVISFLSYQVIKLCLYWFVIKSMVCVTSIWEENSSKVLVPFLSG